MRRLRKRAPTEAELADLRAAVASGTYRVPTLEVADAILAFHARRASPRPRRD